MFSFLGDDVDIPPERVKIDYTKYDIKGTRDLSEENLFIIIEVVSCQEMSSTQQANNLYCIALLNQ